MPPVALTAPRLLAKQSRQLVVSPLVSFSGDGPIASVRLHYRSQDSTRAWSTIVGEWRESWGWERAAAGQGCQIVVRVQGEDGKGERRQQEKRGLQGEGQLPGEVGTE